MNKNCKYDWNEIQKAYDEGLTYRELEAKFGCRQDTINKARIRGELKTRTRSEALKLRHITHEHLKHSESTKKKISESRKKFLELHPEQVPYRLNHYSKGLSYPETYFKKVFENEKIKLEHHYSYGIYELDFANTKKKIDLEIDGDQHYLDKRVVESDIRRTKKLNDDGWLVIRIKWSEYQKFSHVEKTNFLKELKTILC